MIENQVTRLLPTNSSHPDFHALIALLDEYLKTTDGDEHSFYAQYNKVDKIGHVVIAYQGDFAVGCGAFKEIEKGTIEIKRMFVRSECRKQGIAQLLLKKLETWAAELNYQTSILETGKKQVAAIRLYQHYGYQIIPNYGQYQNAENSVCMSKPLRPPSTSP
jgi:putative acetyltransferase